MVILLVMLSLLTVNLKCLDAEMSLLLTSEPSSSSGTFCQGRVQFTCMGTELPIVLNWALNGSIIAAYTFSSLHTYPFPLDPTSSFPPGVVVNVTDAALNVDNTIDITTTLDVSDVSILNQSTLYCEDTIPLIRSDVIDIEVDFRGPASSPQPKCFLQSVSGGLEIVLEWSNEFNAEHVVERYNVRVSPDPASCTSDQVSPSQNYSCPGLDRGGTKYSVSINALNCINQEGESATYDIRPQLLVPASPTGIKVSADLDPVKVEWEEVDAASFSPNCTFDPTIFYTVLLEDNSGGIVEEITTSSDSCREGLCSIILLFSGQYCRVGVTASNVIGNSTAQYASIDAPKLTTPNRILLGLGGILLAVATVICVVIVVVILRKGSKLLSYWRMLCGGLVLMILVAVVLWVAVGFHVGLQDNTCDAAWQNTRDGIIISAFILSILAVAIAIVIAVTVSRRNADAGMKKLHETSGKAKDESELKPADIDPTDAFRPMGGTNVRKDERHEASHALQDVTTCYDVTKHPSIPLAKPSTKGSQNQEYSALQHKTGPNGNHVIVPGPANTYNTLGSVGVKSGVSLPKASEDVDTHRQLGQRGAPKDSSLGSEGDGSSKDELHEVVMEKPWVPCISMRMHNRECRKVDPPIPPEKVAEWFPKHRRWDMKDMAVDHLVVFFMNGCRSEWKYNEDVITHELFMEILNDTWRHYFVFGPQENAHIRVRFQGDAVGSWSALGTFAKYIPKELPTMILNFSNMNSEMIKATILHQFGHALGLGHALMKPEVWEWLRSHVNLREMMAFYGSPSLEAFEMQWTGKGLSGDVVNYNERSIMQYSTDMSWIPKRALDSVNQKKLDIFRKHATTLKIKPTSNDLTTLNITECPDISVDRLIYLGNKQAGTEVRITKELADVWYTIGQKLGVKKEKLEAVGASTDYTNDERLKRVWNLWLYNTDEPLNRKKYPPSWEGFRKLLKNIGKQNVAQEFFEFLNKLY